MKILAVRIGENTDQNMRHIWRKNWPIMNLFG